MEAGERGQHTVFLAIVRSISFEEGLDTCDVSYNVQSMGNAQSMGNVQSVCTWNIFYTAERTKLELLDAFGLEFT